MALGSVEITPLAYAAQIGLNEMVELLVNCPVSNPFLEVQNVDCNACITISPMYLYRAQ